LAILPDAELAVLEIRKLSDYCLDPEHPRGRHKARVFKEALEIGKSDAQWLRLAILDGLKKHDCTPAGKDDFGARWRVDIALRRHARQIVLRTIWIKLNGENAPRFVTCWVL
jgi:hypothetical protein